MPGPQEHLTPDQVAQILDMVQDSDAVIVGGQSLNLWAQHYLPRVPDLVRYAPFTSKDIDFFGSQSVAEELADRLINGELLVPGPDDMTPNAAVVIGMLGDRKVEIDFMRTILGVDDHSITNNFVTLEGRDPATGSKIRMLLLHPLDCLRSRLANVNVLHREDEQSLNQARASVLIANAFVDELLRIGEWRTAQAMLHDLFFVTRNECVGTPAYHHGIDPSAIMRAYVDDDRLDERWRRFILSSGIKKLDAKIADYERRLDILRQRPSGDRSADRPVRAPKP